MERIDIIHLSANSFSNNFSDVLLSIFWTFMTMVFFYHFKTKDIKLCRTVIVLETE